MKKQNGKTIKHFLSKVMMGLLLVSLASGCSPKDNKDSSRSLWLMAGVWLSEISKSNDTAEANGTAQITMALVNSQVDVASVTVTISGAGGAASLAAPIVKPLTKVGQSWQAVISDIPTSTDRIFVGQAYDGTGKLLYEGQAANVAISFNQVSSIFILLQEKNPLPPFANAVPTIDSFVASANLVPVLGTVNFSVTAHDPNPGDTLTYLWSATAGSFNRTGTRNTVWRAPGRLGIGNQIITITVTDNKGSSNRMSFAVEVKSDTGSGSITTGFNTWPVVESIIATDCCITSGASMSLTLIATDVDRDLLSYFWSSSCGTFDNATTQNPIFTATATIAGDCTVKVDLNDGRGGTNSGYLTILIKAPIAPVCADISTLVDGATMTDVCSGVAFTSGANTIINGNVTTLASYTSGLNALVTGNVASGSAYTSGASSIVNGNVSAAGSVTLGAGSKILGSVHSGTGVIIYGANATVGSVLP